MENLNKRPSKGILRFTENVESRSNSMEKEQIKWDEANIKETLNPEDKDYGFMRIDEPPTPYSRSPHGANSEADNSEEDEERPPINELLERVKKKIKEPAVTIENIDGLLDDSDLESEHEAGASSAVHNSSHNSSNSNPSMLDDQQMETGAGSSASDFEMKRKRHYNEFHAVKLAKKLMQKGIQDDNDNDD